MKNPGGSFGGRKTTSDVGCGVYLRLSSETASITFAFWNVKIMVCSFRKVINPDSKLAKQEYNINKKKAIAHLNLIIELAIVILIGAEFSIHRSWFKFEEGASILIFVYSTFTWNLTLQSVLEVRHLYFPSSCWRMFMIWS